MICRDAFIKKEGKEKGGKEKKGKVRKEGGRKERGRRGRIVKKLRGKEGKEGRKVFIVRKFRVSNETAPRNRKG